MNKRLTIIIPARFNSTRLPGKPLLDICGHPMLWWVYKHCSNLNSIDNVIVATDNERVKNMCDENDIRVVLTSVDISTPNDRAYEVAKKIDSDYYIVVNGDEPLISPKTIQSVIPSNDELSEEFFCSYAIAQIKDIAEVIDFSNTKVVFNRKKEVMWISRSPIPYPKGKLNVPYYKMLGIACFSRKALMFYGETKRSDLELVEEIDPYRFIENGIKIHVRLCESDSASVDTLKDLEHVRMIIKEHLVNENCNMGCGNNRQNNS